VTTRILWTLFGLVMVGSILVAGRWRPKEQLPSFKKLPAFELTDQGGQRFGSDDLEGRVWVGAFIFTRCRNACPGMNAEMARVQQAIFASPELRECVRLVSFSVDPSHDSPERLAAFARAYGVDPAIWRFLTGERSTIVRLCEEGFGLAAGGAVDGSGTNSGPVHSDRFALVDGRGRVRGTYRPSAEAGELQRLLEDLELLARELSDSTGD